MPVPLHPFFSSSALIATLYPVPVPVGVEEGECIAVFTNWIFLGHEPDYKELALKWYNVHGCEETVEQLFGWIGLGATAAGASCGPMAYKSYLLLMRLALLGTGFHVDRVAMASKSMDKLFVGTNNTLNASRSELYSDHFTLTRILEPLCENRTAASVLTALIKDKQDRGNATQATERGLKGAQEVFIKPEVTTEAQQRSK
ncbi:unnamed protein product [Cercospora beticola]|nr:unnamed protein product [Cercospora beticola]